MTTELPEALGLGWDQLTIGDLAREQERLGGIAPADAESIDGPVQLGMLAADWGTR